MSRKHMFRAAGAGCFLAFLACSSNNNTGFPTVPTVEAPLDEQLGWIQRLEQWVQLGRELRGELRKRQRQREQLGDRLRQ